MLNLNQKYVFLLSYFERNVQTMETWKSPESETACVSVCVSCTLNLCNYSQVILRKIAGRPGVRGHASEGIVPLKGYLGLCLVP